ncbi:hypothetical protein BH10ACT1_BH10ACT1_08420 [soil metagenome]
MLATVFVYGTLMPGHLRWGLIAPFATSSRKTQVAGELYDTGRGWPAARFAAPLGVPALARPVIAGDAGLGAGIPGWLVELAPSSAATLMSQLDEVEGAVLGEAVEPVGTGAPAADYRRVRVSTIDGVEAWAYEGLVVEDGWQRVPSWSSLDEN